MAETRPSLLTPERQQRIITAISAGNSRDISAAYAGISPKTLFEWLKKGRAAKAGIHREFADAVEKADAEAEVYAVGVVRKAMPDQWQAAAWWLERRKPQDWARHEKVESTVEGHLAVDTRRLVVYHNGEQE